MGIIRRILEQLVDPIVMRLEDGDEVGAGFLPEELESGRRGVAFTELANLLAAHATVEEKISCPAVMTRDTTAQLHEPVEEHLAIKRLLADLIVHDVDDATFKAKIKVLKEQVAHHPHKEEEDKLFRR